MGDLGIVLLLVAAAAVIVLLSVRGARRSRSEPGEPRRRTRTASPPPGEADAEGPPPPPLPPPMSEIPRQAPRRRTHVPSPVPHQEHHLPEIGEPADQHHRTWAERFDLSDDVLAEVIDLDDPVELVRAILSVGGRTPYVHGDVLVEDDVFVALVGHRRGRPLQPNVLSDVYLRYLSSGASRGVVIALGHVDPLEVRRREILAPDLHHEGPEAIQRMADAVVTGADPLAVLVGTGA